MAAPNYRTSTTALVDALKGLFENRTCTEAQAIANATSKPNTIYYTTDTKCVVVGGQIYGRGQQLSSVFRFCPSGSVPGQDPDFSDPDYIYIVPDGTSFTLYWLNPGGAWSHTTGFQFDIATSAEDISYDLTPTPDLGTGNVQSAIEALDGKVEQLSLDTMGKDDSGEYWEDLLFEKYGYSAISANNRRIGAKHLATTDTNNYNRKVYVFPASEGDVFKWASAAGSGDWTGFWKGGTAYASITAANYLSSTTLESGTATAPAGATCFAYVTTDARINNNTAHVWKKTTRPAKTPADIQRQLIELENGSINTSALEVGEVMPYWAAASTIHGIRLEVRKGQVLLLDLVGSANYAPLVFTDEDRVITEIHQTPVYGAFEAPNDGYVYIQKLISHDTDNYLYVMGYGGHAKDMVRIMEDTGEAVDARIDDEKVEFIKERFPSKNVSNYTRHNVNYKFEWVNGQAVYTANTSYKVGYYSKLVPKGSLCQLSLYYASAPSTWGGLSMWGYSTTNIDDYIAENGSIVGLPTIRIKHIHGNGWIRDALFIMPEDGYLICAYQNTYSPTLGTSLIYDVNDLTDLYTEYYKKGLADGSAMASIVGLGYNIWDYITGAVNMAGFEYGCEIRRKYDKTPVASMQNAYKNNTSVVYFPKTDFSGCTTLSGAFYGANKLLIFPSIDVGTKSFTCLQCFTNATSLQYVGDFEGLTITSAEYMFENCPALRRVGKIKLSASCSAANMFNTVSPNLTRVEELDVTAGCLLNTSSYNWNSGAKTGLRFMFIKGWGTHSSQTTLKVNNNWPVWGISTAEVPDARQSLINTLITYSFDRATAGYSACTVTLSAATKALLTEEEIEQITAKGYTIA